MDFGLESAIPTAALLAVPGYLWQSVEQRLALRSRIAATERLLSYTVYSLLTFLALFLLVPEVVQKLFTSNSPSSVELLVLLSLTLGISFLGGAITGWIKYLDLLAKLFRLVGLAAVTNMETGWEKAFRTREGSTIELVFQNGTHQWAIFGDKSGVSSVPGERDVYFERCLIKDKQTGRLVPDPGSKGMWARAEELAIIRFYCWERTKYERQKFDLQRRSAESESAK